MPQLIGDFFKICSYLLSYAFLASGHYKLSMAAELLQAILFWLIATQFGLQHGAIGIAWSYSVTYAIYLLLVTLTFLFIVRRLHLRTKK